MSLTYLDQQLEAIRNRASALRGNLNATKQAINNDASLSQIGKDEALRSANDNAKSALTSLQAEEDKIAADKRAALERTIAGTVGTDSASIISYRDAQDRADKLDGREDAARLMTRALTSGDKSLASAVAQAAVARGWSDVYEPYAAQNPSIAEAVEDLAALNRYFDDIGMVLTRAMTYSVA